METDSATTADGRDARSVALEAKLGEFQRLAAQLLRTEQQLAEIPALRLQIADLEYELAVARATADALREQLAELEQRLMRSQQTLGSMMRSPSWRLTKPLRVAKRLIES